MGPSGYRKFKKDTKVFTDGDVVVAPGIQTPVTILYCRFSVAAMEWYAEIAGDVKLYFWLSELRRK